MSAEIEGERYNAFCSEGTGAVFESCPVISITMAHDRPGQAVRFTGIIRDEYSPVKLYALTAKCYRPF